MSYTPGPWKVTEYITMVAQTPKLRIETDKDVVATIENLWRNEEMAGPTEEAQFNARLIAAAPALLDFIRMIANGGLDSGDSHEQIESEAREILAQAEGDPHATKDP